MNINTQFDTLQEVYFREYYRKEKSHILKYTNTQTPDWI